MQLVGGDGISEGRVEYCRDNLWTSVCYNGWDHYDAQVVCRQLGFSEYTDCHGNAQAYYPYKSSCDARRCCRTRVTAYTSNVFLQLVSLYLNDKHFQPTLFTLTG